MPADYYWSEAIGTAIHDAQFHLAKLRSWLATAEANAIKNPCPETELHRAALVNQVKAYEKLICKIREMHNAE